MIRNAKKAGDIACKRRHFVYINHTVIGISWKDYSSQFIQYANMVFFYMFSCQHFYFRKFELVLKLNENERSSKSFDSFLLDRPTV